MVFRCRIALWALAGAAFACGGLAAKADDEPSAEQRELDRAAHQREVQFMKTLFGAEAPTTRARACFVRRYDAAHMYAHPHQKVLEIRISVHYAPTVKPATENESPGSHWGYAIRTRLRGGKQKTFLDDGSCWAGAVNKDEPRGPSFKVRCNAACDAGDDLYVDDGGKTALLANKEDLIHPELDGPGADPKQQAKLDDSVFRVYRAEDAECAFDKP